MKDLYITFNLEKITYDEIVRIKKYAALYPGRTMLINVSNTTHISIKDILEIEKQIDAGRIKIRIEGDYTEERIKNYPKQIYVDMHRYDNIYTLNETKAILKELEKIESGINYSWSPEQKLIYFISYLRNKIIYHPYHENAPSHEIRSLRGLISHKTVCAGYAMILKELCDRNGIYCEYVEGVCNEDDLNKGILTHAWNIVRIMGYAIPIDLTWNARNSKSGKTLAFEDIANVNEFIKAHIPGKYEKTQNYERTLKSIDGKYIQTINNLINKDMTYDSACMRGRRDDGEEFLITQVEERVIDNESLYTYIYSVLRKDGSMGESLIFYSKINVAGVVDMVQRKRKMERQLADARRHNDTKEIQRLEEALRGSEHLEDEKYAIDNLLFSRENMSESIKRRDFYLGKVEIQREIPRKVKGVFVDPEFGQRIGKKSKVFFRSNGTSFVVEDWRNILLNNGCIVYRYKLYEFVNIDGKMVLKKNTIYTDEDILTDGRKRLADDFLARDRIDRKLKETGGYLGFYSKDCVRTYDPRVNHIFKTSIYEQYRIRREHIRDYYKDLSFDDMKRMVKTYDIETRNNKNVVFNRHSGVEVTDEILCLQVKFTYIWLSSAGIKWIGGESISGYTYAFELDSSKNIFELICKCINDSINKYGIIDPVDILDNVLEKCGNYKYASEIVVAMFSNQERLEIIRNLFMLQNPSSYKVNTIFSTPLRDGLLAQQLLNKRRRELEERKKQVLEVIKNGSSVEIRNNSIKK